MTEKAPVALEPYASLRAEIDAGEPLDIVLEREKLTPEAWASAQAFWLKRMAEEAETKRFSTTTRYQTHYRTKKKLFEAERDRKRRKAEQTEPPPPPVEALAAAERELQKRGELDLASLTLAAPPMIDRPVMTPSYQGHAAPLPPPPISSTAAAPPPPAPVSAPGPIPIPAKVARPEPVTGITQAHDVPARVDPPPGVGNRDHVGSTQPMPPDLHARLGLPFERGKAAAPSSPGPAPPAHPTPPSSLPPETAAPAPVKPRTPDGGEGVATRTMSVDIHQLLATAATPFDKRGPASTPGVPPMVEPPPVTARLGSPPSVEHPLSSTHLVDSQGPPTRKAELPFASPVLEGKPPERKIDLTRTLGDDDDPQTMSLTARAAPRAATPPSGLPFMGASGVAAPPPVQPRPPSSERSALPFQSTPATSSPRETATTGPAVRAPEAAAAAARGPQPSGKTFTINQFASLTAEIAENPENVEDIRRKYGISEVDHRAESARWTEDFATNSELRQRYLGIVTRYRQYLKKDRI